MLKLVVILTQIREICCHMIPYDCTSPTTSTTSGNNNNNNNNNIEIKIKNQHTK